MRTNVTLNNSTEAHIGNKVLDTKQYIQDCKAAQFLFDAQVAENQRLYDLGLQMKSAQSCKIAVDETRKHGDAKQFLKYKRDLINKQNRRD